MAPKGVESDLLSRRFRGHCIVQRQVTRLAGPLERSPIYSNVSGPFIFEFERPIYLSISPTVDSVCADCNHKYLGGLFRFSYFLFG